jgi:hypothetical protein
MKNENVTSNEVVREKSFAPITVARVFKGDYQKEGTLTAELKQAVTITSHYPTRAIVNSLQDNIFSAEDFSFEPETHVNVETRVAWINIPENASINDVETRLKKAKKAVLYRIMSNRPILTDNQQNAINNPDLEAELDTFALTQVVRYGEDRGDLAGKLILDRNGKVQYRSVFFSSEPKEDEDRRNADLEDVYIPEEIHAELVGETPTIEGQDI